MNAPGKGGRRLEINYSKPSDPSAEESRAVRDVVERVGARVINEIPGTLHVEGSDADVATLRDLIERLPGWTLGEEGVAKMPPTRGLPRRNKR